jgi:hypothetical protein
VLLRALIFGLALAASGCTQVQLARSTINQGNTLADMQRRQVLDNLAMFRADPDALAWHLKLRGGLVQVADQGSVSILGVLFNDASMSPSGGFQRGVVGQWDVEPAVDVDELESLQLAYRLAVNPQDAQARREIYKTIGETAVSHHIVLSESALEKLIAALVADPAEREAYHARNRMLRMELRNQASIIEQLRASGAPQVDSAFRSPNGAFSDQGIERLKAMLDSRVLTADTAQAWVMLTTEARVLTEDNVIKLTQEVCGAEMHFVPRYPIDGRRERNVALVDQAEEKIDKLFELLEEEQFQRPWLFFGKKCDVPRDACDVGRYGRCYVWTSPQTRRTLTDFVLIVLALVPSNEQDISGGGAPGGGGGVAYSPTLANGS